MKLGLVGKAVWALGGGGALAISGIVQGIVIARFLGPDGAGTFGYMVWTTSIVSLVFSLGLTHSATKFVAELGAADAVAGHNASIYFARRSAVLSVFAVLAHAFAVRLWAVPGTGIEWLVCSVYFALMQANSIFAGLAYGFQRFRLVTVVSLLGAGLQLGASLLLVPRFGVTGALVGLSIGMLPGAVLAGQMILARTSAALPPAALGRIWRYTIPAWISALLFALAWTRTEVFFLERFRDAASVAFFTTGLTLANVATQAPQMLMNALFPHFSGLAATNPQALINVTVMSLRLAAWSLLPAAIFAAAGAPFWITTMYGEKFSGAGQSGVVMSLLAGLMLFAPTVQFLIARARSDLILYQNILSGLLSVTLCWGLIPAWGIAGALVARSVSNVAGVIFWLVSFRRLAGINPPLAQVARIALAALISVWPIVAVTCWARPTVVLMAAATLLSVALYLGLTRWWHLLDEDDAGPVLRWVKALPFGLSTPTGGTIAWLSGASRAVS